MDVDALIGHVTLGYATARSYSDRGKLICDLGGGGGYRVEFETEFERDGPFSFSSRVKGAGDTFRCDGTFWVRSDGHDIEVGELAWPAGFPKTLGFAIGALTGVSMGTAHLIPRLLMPEIVEGRSIFDGPNRKLDDEVTIDNVPHFVVESGAGDDFTRTYVEKATLQVRKIEQMRPRDNRRADPDGPHVVTAIDFDARLTPGFTPRSRSPKA